MKALELTVQKHSNLRWICKRRNYFYLPVLLIMALCFWGKSRNHLIIWPVGLSIIALGLLIRIWATKHIGIRILRKYKDRETLPLVVTGPYSLVRNPLYIGNILVIVGLCIFSELLWLTPIVLIYFFILYSLVVRYEEYKLSALFEREYEIYKQKIPRWILRFTMIRKIKSGGSSWYAALNAELPSFAYTSAAILTLLSKEFFFDAIKYFQI